MNDKDALPQVGARHYVALCGLCLAVIFLVQLQMGLVLTNALAVLVGAASLVYWVRLGPMLLVILVGGAQLSRQMAGGRGGEQTLEATDVMLCAAVLGFVAGHYRLQGIWHQLLPTDPRARAGTPRRVFPWIKKQVPIVREKRPAGLITPHELAWFVVTLPAWAVAAQLARALLPRHWNVLGLPEQFFEILTVLWLLAVGLGVAVTFLNLWKHRRHDPATAQLYLQDLLWRDTRGEQRRVNRWLAWWRLARTKRKIKNW
jgi:hypothetical protein